MKTGIRALVLIGLACVANATVATAGEVRRFKSADGVIVTHRAKSDNYCLRTSSDKPARRLGLRVHATECKSRTNWARAGLTIVSRGQQVASAR